MQIIINADSVTSTLIEDANRLRVTLDGVTKESLLKIFSDEDLMAESLRRHKMKHNDVKISRTIFGDFLVKNEDL